ncbi:MAG: glycosyltransferase family 4 protein, partial [Chloroflexi bacterium]|nr:glycosyltransferase family 4 protein [Chloroflexota bacterium]
MKHSSNGIKRFATTFETGFLDPRFAARARKIDVPSYLELLPRRKFNLLQEARLFWRVLRAALREDVLLLFSSRGHLKPELMAVLLISFWPKRFRPKIVLYGEMYEPDRDVRGWLEEWVIRLADRAIYRYVVYSHDEADIFPRNWGVAADKMRVCLFYTLNARPEITVAMHSRGRHIFAGGNSFRDYAPLLQAARCMPETEFIVCTARLEQTPDLPHNVNLTWPSKEEYERLIHTSAAVVVPIRLGLRRSAGLLTYIESMWLKKPTIVTDSLSVRDYVVDGETGLIVDGSPDSYVDAIRWVLDPQNAAAVNQMCERAH